jgi:cytochrome c551
LAAAIAEAESLYRARCIGCHKAGGGSGPNLFRTRLSTKQFTDEVQTGGNGMPSFRELLSQDEILKIHALVLTRDQL